MSGSLYCVFIFPRRNSPECKLSGIRPQAWLPFRRHHLRGWAEALAGLEAGEDGRTEGEDTSEGGAQRWRVRAARAAGLRIQGRDRGTRPAGGSPAGHGDLHLGGRDAARQGVELAQRRHVLGLLHRPPRPLPKLVDPCAIHAFPGATETVGSPPTPKPRLGGKGRRDESEEGAWVGEKDT